MFSYALLYCVIYRPDYVAPLLFRVLYVISYAGKEVTMMSDVLQNAIARIDGESGSAASWDNEWEKEWYQEDSGNYEKSWNNNSGW